jgi:MFS transporter, MHS family, proline/betaine transporter
MEEGSHAMAIDSGVARPRAAVRAPASPVERSRGLDHARIRQLILAGSAGNIMEWYDFSVYGYFAATIGRLFFPAGDGLSSLTASFGVFAGGFLMRPIGSAVFGHIGDRVGRKAALVLSTMLMAVPTCLIGLLPTYDQIGFAAPLLLVLLRLVQGLSVGGEFTTSGIFLAEGAAPGRRGFLSSWSFFGAIGGSLLGSAVGAAITTALDPGAAAAWGWRVAFVLGLGVGLSGFVVRRQVVQEPLAARDQGRPAAPVVEAFRTEWRTMLRIVALTPGLAVGGYLCFIYAPTWVQQTTGLPASTALAVNTAAMALGLALIPTMGALSDRIGRKPVLLGGAAGLVLCSWPLLWLMQHPWAPLVLLGQAGFAVLVAALQGTITATMVEATPRRLRVSTLSIGYNVSLALFGGTTPLVATYLIQRSHDPLSPGLYLMAAALVSFLALLRQPETYRSPLP